MSTQSPPPVAPGQQWMQKPTEVAVNCPPGLEYLTQVDQILIQQQVELLEAFTGFETANKYAVKNSMGQQIYFAAEDTDCCTRNICGPKRAYEMQIFDNFSKEVLHLSRPWRCDTCWCFCCLQKIEVQAPPGNTIGYVVQDCSLCKPHFSIQNATGETVLKIVGPFCTWSLCGDVEFDVLSKDGDHLIGRIAKQWTGFVKETFTDADNYGISFPMDLDVNVKATLMGACFLIEYMYFEMGPKDNKKD